MANSLKKWPGINISDKDRDIVTRIREDDGILRSVDMKDLLQIAAAMAVKYKAPPLLTSEPLTRQISHSTLVNKDEYAEYRQYIALIFYITAGNKDLSSMSDTSVMMKNFIDHAQRGLRLIEANYLGNKEGSENFVDEMVSLLDTH